MNPLRSDLLLLARLPPLAGWSEEGAPHFVVPTQGGGTGNVVRERARAARMGRDARIEKR